MKKILVVVLLFTGFGAAAQNTEQSKVNQSLVKLFEALASLDINGIKEFSTKDLIILESGAVWNLDTIAYKINELKSVGFSRTNHLDFIQTEVKGSTAWSVYYNSADMIIDGVEVHRRWLESAVLIKENNAWKIKMLHSTTLKWKE